MDLRELLYILSVLLLEAKTVFGAQCSYTAGAITVTLTCEHGCCESNCCSESPSFDWEWYIIAGIVIGGIFVLACIIGLVIYTCIHCCCKRKQAPRRTEVANRVYPNVTIIRTGNNNPPSSPHPPPAAFGNHRPNPPSYQGNETPPPYTGPPVKE